MSGAFQTSREIFDNPIWKNIVEFRLFFLIYGSAVFAEDGYRISDDLHLERGQWLRSTRKIQEDLTYVENRQVKTYSTSVINRCIKSLVASQRVCTKTHELGTVFTVVNYEQYQGFGSYKKDNLERNLEQYQNSVGTVEEQSGNNNKKEKKEKEGKESKEDKPSSRKRPVYESDSIPYRSASYLIKKIREHSPEIKEPNLQQWANDMRMMIEIDKREPITIANVIDWVTKDSFWQTNILSASKLREKFDTLQGQMKRGGNNGHVISDSGSIQQHTEPEPDWNKFVYRGPA